LGVRLLKPGGLLCFIVTNKWIKAGYGAPLRRFFSEKAWVGSVVDSGHARRITSAGFQMLPANAGIKVDLARRLRRETTLSLKWIAQQLGVGSWK
jgi:hypothetical protein